jgi:sporulation protein YhbH
MIFGETSRPLFLSIDQDTSRYRQIVRGKIRQNLRKYISNSQLIGRKGKDLVSIPISQIELPTFRFGDQGQGVGQGEGEIGTPIGQGEPGAGDGQAGDQPGAHLMEVELTLEELAELLGEELELPRIQPKGKRNVESEIYRFTGISRVGPEGLHHFKRTYREALKRQMASGTYDPAHPAVTPVREDKRYRSWKVYPRPENSAVVFYMMDVSGSMTDNKKRLVRLTAFWIDTWLQANYKNITTRYIVHDANAQEVNAETFYHIHEDGGTRISSAYQLCQQIIQAEYDPQEWNMYAFHFSDGENYSNEDDQRCMNILQDTLLPEMNLFGYGQVRSEDDNLFRKVLENHFDDEKLSTAQINEDEDIYTAIKTFLGKGL